MSTKTTEPRLSERPKTERPLRLAIIGCGFQGAHHAKAASGCRQVELVAACDEMPDSAQSLASAFGVDRWTVDSASVLEDPDVDAVVISTTTHTHAELAIAAAEHGKHILLEKPMATSVADCLRIEDAVRASGVTLVVGFKFRFAPAVVAARRAVLRPIVLTAHTLYDADQTASGWVNDRSLSGGRLMSSLVHSIDLLRFLSGSEPIRVGAEGGALAVEGSTEPDNAVATVLFDNGSIASIVHGSAGRSGLLSTWSFQTSGPGLNATVFDHGRRMRLHEALEEQGPDVIDPVEDAFAAGMQPLMQAFADAASARRQIAPGPRDGTISVLVSKLVERAIETGRTQDVDLSSLAG